MKLVRFALKAEPDITRTGMLHNGRVYETQEGEAVGVHEVSEVRPLAPVERAASVRLFERFGPGSPFEADAEEPLSFVYANPAAVVGPSQLLALPGDLGRFAVRTYLAAIVTDSIRDLDEEDAERIILGYTLLSAVALEFPARERRGAAFDFGMNVGPVVTTPDELLDVLDARGYALTATLRVQGVEKATTGLLPFSPTLAAAVASASRTAPLRAGDLVAVGPVFDPDARRGRAGGRGPVRRRAPGDARHQDRVYK